MPTTTTTTVSAPGKVLLAGGYLVLEQPNIGLVFAANNCCFHATIGVTTVTTATLSSSLLLSHDADDSDDSNRLSIEVHSPQFHAIYEYWLTWTTTTTTFLDNDYDNDDDDYDDTNDNDLLVQLLPKSNNYDNRNIFIEKTLSTVFAFILYQMDYHIPTFLAFVTSNNDDVIHTNTLGIKLRADNDFYSQMHHLEACGMALTPGNMARLDPFLPCPISKSKNQNGNKVIVNKTGMGSSAALVTSLVGSLLVYFGIVTLPTSTSTNSNDVNVNNIHNYGVQIVHNLSQICHSIAQGKVGSGFDVASACFGSLAYTRFHPDLIASNIRSFTNTNTNMSSNIASIVTDVDRWDYTRKELSLPRGIELLMADVCGGSESPSMAKRVMSWRRKAVGAAAAASAEGLDDSYSNAHDIWDRLKKGNEEVLHILQQFPPDLGVTGVKLSALSSSEWKDLIAPSNSADKIDDSCSSSLLSSKLDFTKEETEILHNLNALHDVLIQNRTLLKSLGGAAGGVPIEPDSQSSIANVTQKVNGVIACGVPGAGGFDALYVLYLKGDETDSGKSDVVRDEIAQVWETIGKSQDDVKNDNVRVCPLTVNCSNNIGEWCGVRNSSDSLGW